MSVDTSAARPGAGDPGRACPICEGTDARWCGSAPGADWWCCRVCGHEWSVPVAEPARRAPVPVEGHAGPGDLVVDLGGATVLAPVESCGAWVLADLVFDPDDPWAVRLRFRRQGLDWVMGRELLAAGLLGPAGEGDVRVEPWWPDDRDVLVTLRPPQGPPALIKVERRRIERFLADSYRAVPLGREAVDVDLALELLRVEESW